MPGADRNTRPVNPFADAELRGNSAGHGRARFEGRGSVFAGLHRLCLHAGGGHDDDHSHRPAFVMPNALGLPIFPDRRGRRMSRKSSTHRPAPRLATDCCRDAGLDLLDPSPLDIELRRHRPRPFARVARWKTGQLRMAYTFFSVGQHFTAGRGSRLRRRFYGAGA